MSKFVKITGRHDYDGGTLFPGHTLELGDALADAVIFAGHGEAAEPAPPEADTMAGAE